MKDHTMNELAVVQNIHVGLESPSRSFGKVVGGWISMKVIKLRPYADSVVPDGDLRFFEDGTGFLLSCLWDLGPFAASERRKSVLSIMKETELLVIPLGFSENQDP
ncbi:hypothetical protein F4782DRAFT_211832 [Xylaria castorea]|nr:hypothetical protein F4782DRAFT_211832 [Xylaria castorea]